MCYCFGDWIKCLRKSSTFRKMWFIIYIKKCNQVEFIKKRAVYGGMMDELSVNGWCQNFNVGRELLSRGITIFIHESAQPEGNKTNAQ